MPHEDHRLGDKPRRINIVTFSGAHGVGKSTLISDLKVQLESDGRSVFTVPSVSSYWFKNQQTYCKVGGVPVPVTYDDINLMGYREQMQQEMPEILKEFIEEEVTNAMACTYGGVVLVDRWFSDIATYTAVELPTDRAEAINQSNKKTHGWLLDCLSDGQFQVSGDDHLCEFFLTHIFIPSTSCSHILPIGKTEEKAHRGTTPIDLWESTYARVNVFTESKRTLIISTSDRLQRVEEITAGFL